MSVQALSQLPTALRRPVVVPISRAGAVTAAGVAVTSLVLGALTAYGQGHLPTSLGPLANSPGSWVVVAFGLAFIGRRPWSGAALGALGLVGLLAGYVVGELARGYPSAVSTVEFWGLAALWVGPVLGLAAYAVRSGSPGQAAFGTGLVGGVLVGEAVYRLTSLDQPARFRTPGYWWAELAVGVTLLLVLGTLRFRSPRPFGEAVLTCAIVTAGVLGTSLLNLLVFVG